MNPKNPFEVLHLDPRASEEEVVRQAGRLRQRARDEATLNAIRQAVQQLTRSAEERALHAVLTHPAPGYSSPQSPSPAEQLRSAFRRPPTPEHPQPCPPLSLDDFSDLLLGTLVEEMKIPDPVFESLGQEETPEEIHRQTVEALWQALLHDPGG
jgi:hypothetical protein